MGAEYHAAATNQWYAMQTKVHKEALVCQQLEQRGIEIFYPKLRVKPVNPRSRKERPYFPGYIFNLGHGITPDINPEKIKYLTDIVRDY